MEDHEEADKNFAQLRASLPSSTEMISDPRCIVMLTLSREAMLRLGKELIREALSDREWWALRPSEPGAAVQNLGIYPHPLSYQLMIGKTDMGTLEDVPNEGRGDRS